MTFWGVFDVEGPDRGPSTSLEGPIMSQRGMGINSGLASDAAEGVGPAFCPEREVIPARAACPQYGWEADDGKVEPAQHQGLACVTPLVHLLIFVVTIPVVYDDVPPQGDPSWNAGRIMQLYATVVVAFARSVIQ